MSAVKSRYFNEMLTAGVFGESTTSLYKFETTYCHFVISSCDDCGHPS